tara:strand:- start:32 stop:280 length:249 start_codon:yes stop_codon:yes gene_type:complete
MTNKITLRVNNGDPVTFAPDDDSKIPHIRAERNSLLAKSDSMMVSDRGLTDAKKAEWVAYRKALRDMDFSDPDNITWPTKPE